MRLTTIPEATVDECLGDTIEVIQSRLI